MVCTAIFLIQALKDGTFHSPWLPPGKGGGEGGGGGGYSFLLPQYVHQVVGVCGEKPSFV